MRVSGTSQGTVAARQRQLTKGVAAGRQQDQTRRNSEELRLRGCTGDQRELGKARCAKRMDAVELLGSGNNCEMNGPHQCMYFQYRPISRREVRTRDMEGAL